MLSVYLCRQFIICLLALTSGDRQVLNQHEVGLNTCGPCALINSLQRSNAQDMLDAVEGETDIEKAQWFTRVYGRLPSVVYTDDRHSYAQDTGIADQDLKYLVNHFLEDHDKPLVDGGYIVRNEMEADAGFVERIYSQIQTSLDAGFGPLLSIRALAAQKTEDPSRRVWNSLGGHWIAIHGVERIEDSPTSFLIHFSDSLSGKHQTGIVSLNLHRKAVVPMTFTLDEEKKEVWDWVSNVNTLELLAPDMPLGTTRADWDERTFIAIRYIVYQREDGTDPQ